MNHRSHVAVAAAFLGLAATPLAALVQPRDSPINDRAFRHEQLNVGDRYERASAIAAKRSQAVRNLASLSVSTEGSHLDLRSGRWGTLMPVTPMLPGRNRLTWDGLEIAAPDAAGLRAVAWNAFVGYLKGHEDALLIDVDQLTNPGSVAVHEGGRLLQIYAPRTVTDIPVRNSFLTAVIRHGNLILFGSRNWGDVETSPEPTLSEGEARAAVLAHLSPFLTTGWNKSDLIFVPVATDDEAIGKGVAYRLAWTLQPRIDNDRGSWEALIDAHSGELLAFEDQNQYAATRVVEGGVYPVSNNGLGPEGTEQPDFPMPFADVNTLGNNYVTDAGGNLLACIDGSYTSDLDGPFVTMNDNCGPISETSAGAALDFGTSGGTDCVTPPGADSPGNTHASRSGFYELNRIIEMARGQLPSNPWLSQQLTANMNISASCNASWNGEVNFFRSGGFPPCANTGELAGVFDHEWGHGMDNNDVNPSISSPGEGIADIYAYLRLDTSCIGTGFSLGSPCNGYGDPCIGSPPCDGVRDIDWANRASMAPHDVDWIDANCGSGESTPCGGSTHCEGAVYAEAVYDLVNRDLAASGFDHNTALEIATRLTYLGGGVVGNWFACTSPFGGCNADGGYLNFLAVDDDGDGLANGTPHIEEIFAAFDRHQIACDSPQDPPVNSGCTGTPMSAPTVTATALDRGVFLDWGGALAGGTTYKVYRTDGVRGCDFGKVLLGETSGTTFFDSGLKNGHEYYYTVIPFGPDDSCFGPASVCTSVTPVAGANLALGQNPQSSILPGGDNDVFLDNCEQARVQFEVVNVGAGAATNVRITGVTSPTHPGIDIVTALPLILGDYSGCTSKSAAIDFQADGVTAAETIELEVTFTSDELSPQVKAETVEVNVVSTESDFVNFATKTFSFETDLEGWTVVSGRFGQVADTGNAGGAPPSDGYTASSSNTPNICDNIRSPVLSLASDSTMTLWTNFDIEGFCDPPQCNPASWYDRANVAIFDNASDTRTVVEPSSGRAYNASGLSATTFCTNDQPGWAGAMPTWATSEFSAANLGAVAIAGDLVRIDIAYGTDPAANPEGFWFDELTLTNVHLQDSDSQSDVCLTIGLIFSDGFESGDASTWSATSP